MSDQPKIGSRPTGGETAEAAPEAKGGKKKLPIIIGAVVVVLAGAAYWFLAGPGAAAPAAEVSADPSAEPSYELGEVMVVEPISINLDGGHYLRLGFAMQLTADAGGHGAAVDTAKALDAAIALFSGRTTEELADPDKREELKKELGETLKELYHEEVVGVYYTDFVTQ